MGSNCLVSYSKGCDIDHCAAVVSTQSRNKQAQHEYHVCCLNERQGKFTRVQDIYPRLGDQLTTDQQAWFRSRHLRVNFAPAKGWSHIEVRS
jgi:hypothetical protein